MVKSGSETADHMRKARLPGGRHKASAPVTRMLFAVKGRGAIAVEDRGSESEAIKENEPDVYKQS